MSADDVGTVRRCRLRADRASIDAALVRRLVDAQFPQWRGLPIRPVSTTGGTTARSGSGEELSIRLPSAGLVPRAGRQGAALAAAAGAAAAAAHPASPWPRVRRGRGTRCRGRCTAGSTGAPAVLLGDVSRGCGASPRRSGGFLVALRCGAVEAARHPATHNFFRGRSARGLRRGGARRVRRARARDRRRAGRARSGRRPTASRWEGAAGLVPRRHRARQPAGDATARCRP